MHLHEPDPAPRWPQGPGRTAAQRAAAVFLLAAGPASAAYWTLHGLPDGAPMPTPLLLCLLAMAPVGLWLLLACPPLRPQRPDELAVFHAGWQTPVGVGLVVLCAGFAAALPALLTGDDLVGGLVVELLLLVWLVLSALVMAAARNERLLLAADGRIEATGAGGRTRIAELHEAASLRVTLLGTSRICDAEGRTLCTFGKDAVNCKRLLARLQQRGIGFATPHDQARANRFPLPKVRTWLALGMFALALCFPMGYSLNLKLSAPAVHRTLPVVETLLYNSRVTDDGHTYALVCALDGARVKLAVDRDAWLQAQQDPVADVLVWESPLGIRLVQRAC